MDGAPRLEREREKGVAGGLQAAKAKNRECFNYKVIHFQSFFAPAKRSLASAVVMKVPFPSNCDGRGER